MCILVCSFTHIRQLAHILSCIPSIYRERRHRITVGTMSGVIQKTAERDMLEGAITSYFTDTLQSFVNKFQMNRDGVCQMEGKIVKQLTVS